MSVPGDVSSNVLVQLLEPRSYLKSSKLAGEEEELSFTEPPKAAAIIIKATAAATIIKATAAANTGS